MGDLGGLYDALRLIGQTLTSPFTYLSMKVVLLVSLFKPNHVNINEDKELKNKTKPTKDSQTDHA